MGIALKPGESQEITLVVKNDEPRKNEILDKKTLGKIEFHFMFYDDDGKWHGKQYAVEVQ